MTNDKMLNLVFDSMENGAAFSMLDTLVTKECEKQMKECREKLLPQEYEKLRDAVFSISYITKKEAFQIGFRSAMQLILECRDDSL